jgi:hypothetical protein
MSKTHNHNLVLWDVVTFSSVDYKASNTRSYNSCIFLNSALGSPNWPLSWGMPTKISVGFLFPHAYYQSAQRLEYRLDNWGFGGRGKRFYVLHKVQIGSGAHLAPYTKHMGGYSSGVKQQGRETIRLPLVPRLSMVENYLHSPICLHSVVLKSLNLGIAL